MKRIIWLLLVSVSSPTVATDLKGQIDSLSRLRSEHQKIVEDIGHQLDSLRNIQAIGEIKEVQSKGITIQTRSEGNLRETPSPFATVLGRIPELEKVLAFEMDGEYWKVVYGGKVGYISEVHILQTDEVREYLEIKSNLEIKKRLDSLRTVPQVDKNRGVDEKIVLFVTPRILNVRKSLGQSSKVISKLSRGDEVIVVNRISPWVKIQLADTVGWVHENYVGSRFDVKRAEEADRRAKEKLRRIEEGRIVVEKRPRIKQYNPDCKRHIELHSAHYLANDSGRTEMWVLHNVRINLWEKTTSEGKGRAVGKMLPGSRAEIITISVDDYKVRSPLDQSVGWVNGIQVSRTLKQNIKTRKPCN